MTQRPRQNPTKAAASAANPSPAQSRERAAGQPYYAAESFEPMRSIGFLIKRCGALMTQVAERRFEGQPISFTQWLGLMKLRYHAHLSATQLSAEIGHDMGALTRVVDGLESAGFVRRERSRQDRRAVEITLTAAGRRQVEARIQVLVDAMNELVETFSHSEVDTLIGLMQRMLAVLQDAVDEVQDPRPVAQRPLADFIKPITPPRKTPAARRGKGGKA